MTWGNKSNYNTTYLDAGTDSPADARPQLKNAVDELTNVIDGLNTSGGAAKLDATTSKVIANSGIQSTGDVAITPVSGGSVDIEDILNLNPKTVTELNALTSEEGDVAYCSNGNAGSKCVAVYDGSNWKVVALGSTIATS
tara:strand:- start:548 stop:967 length:420 start_codon:yes stop_codon:yes gene_type:complete